LRYALICLDEEQPFPKEVTWHLNLPAKASTVTWLETGQKLHWKIDGDSVRVTMPQSVNTKNAGRPFPALALAFTPSE
jgi:hypothetical protein